MNCEQLMEYLKDSVPYANQSFDIFVDNYNNASSNKHWLNTSKVMGKELQKYTGFDCYVTFRKDPNFALYDISICGSADVPDECYREKELDINIVMSPELYTRKLFLGSDANLIQDIRESFVLTFIHELNHTTQFDDGSTYADYYSSPLEIDSYSSELAFDMFLYNRKRSFCESYKRYNTLKKRDVFREFRDMSLRKYQYLKKYK